MGPEYQSIHSNHHSNSSHSTRSTLSIHSHNGTQITHRIKSSYNTEYAQKPPEYYYWVKDISNPDHIIKLFNCVCHINSYNLTIKTRNNKYTNFQFSVCSFRKWSVN